jgi:hypothetical protein
MHMNKHQSWTQKINENGDDKVASIAKETQNSME